MDGKCFKSETNNVRHRQNYDKKCQKHSKKRLTQKLGRCIIHKLARESTAMNLENDTETETQKEETADSGEVELRLWRQRNSLI